MIPSITAVRLTGAPDRAELPLLVLGPTSGMAAVDLWLTHVAELVEHHDVLGLDLPGQGYNRAPVGEWSPAELAAGVAAVVDDVLEQRGERGAAFTYVVLEGSVGAELVDHLDGRLSQVASVRGPEHVGAVLGVPAEPGGPDAVVLDARSQALVRVAVLATRGSVAAAELTAAAGAGLTPAEVRAAVDLARELG